MHSFIFIHVCVLLLSFLTVIVQIERERRREDQSSRFFLNEI